MREIKFRAWDNLVNRYQYFTLEKLTKYSWDEVKWNNLSIEQYTGLKDKHSKEIYEGDIVMLAKLRLQVIYQAPSFVMKEKLKNKIWFTFDIVESQNQFVEIIGNIHENPELLKEPQ
jgi:uncharacterized phage protein (TIGR01671 family)